MCADVLLFKCLTPAHRPRRRPRAGRAMEAESLSDAGSGQTSMSKVRECERERDEPHNYVDVNGFQEQYTERVANANIF